MTYAVPKRSFNFLIVSWGLTYNLFADKLLKLNLFPNSIYTMRSFFYFCNSRCK